MLYTIVLTPEPGGSAVNVIVPAMPGVQTWGGSRAEALSAAHEAIELHLEGFAELGAPFPADRKPRRRAATPARMMDNGGRDGGRPFREVVTIDVKEPTASVRTA